MIGVFQTMYGSVLPGDTHILNNRKPRNNARV